VGNGGTSQHTSGDDPAGEPTPVFMPADDGFHFDALGDDWWATETSWFSFHHPERRLGGWFYSLIRPNIGTVQGGLWIWDDTAVLPWEVPYSTNFSTLQLPAGTDLTNAVLPTGVGMRVIEPGMSYALTYDDPGRVTVDLRFDGVMPPEPMRTGRSTFGKAAHFDQFGRVTGTVVLHGEEIRIDCIAARDRTWGRRREDRPHRAAYLTGASSPGDAFLAVTRHADDREAVAYGFLRRDGITIPVVGGERRAERNPEHGWVERVVLTMEDEQGRTMEAVGTPVNRIIINRHTFIDINSLLRWECTGGPIGEVAWGEDQDMWPVHDWSASRRSPRGGGRK